MPTPSPLQRTLQRTGPRRLLSLDGGGIRGVITLEVLKELEAQLQKALGRGNDFVLADYFDYVAGTSTGAIIGTCIALGMRIQQIATFYEESGPAMFDKAGLLDRFCHGKFHDAKLVARLQQLIGEQTGNPLATFGSEALRTLLLVVLRNATTDSPWPLSNNPAAKYNQSALPDNNLNLPLWQVVRGSTAAPTYFPPEVVTLGTKEFIFVDGGVTMYNNPAFQLFLMATAEPYNLQWKTGENEMLLVSIGTGMAPMANDALKAGQMHLLYHASSIPGALMTAATYEQDLLCRMFGKCLVGDALDSEVGDLIAPRDPAKGHAGNRGPGPKLFTYLRYNAELTEPGLRQLGLDPAVIQPAHVQEMDSVTHIPQMQAVGRAIARKVNLAHYQGFLG